MSGYVSLLNHLAGAWSEVMGRASWQGAAALGVAWLICRCASGLPADARCWLWRLAYLKLFLALFWATPVDLPLLPPRSLPVPVRVSAPVLLAPERERGLNGPILDPRSRPPLPVRLASARLRMEVGLLLLWLVGAGWQFVRLARRARRSRALGRRSIPCDGASTQAQLQALCHRLRLRACPELRLAEVSGPLLLGPSRPTILLPLHVPLREEERLWVLAHELAHVRRRDLWWSALAAGLQALFFFHPALWLARAEWQLAQEMACDALTLRITSVSAGDYGELLLRLATRGSVADETGFTVAGILETGSSLERRLKVLRKDSRIRPGRPLIAASVAAFALGGLVPWRVVSQAAAQPVTPRVGEHRLTPPAPTPAVTPRPVAAASGRVGSATRSAANPVPLAVTAPRQPRGLSPRPVAPPRTKPASSARDAGKPAPKVRGPVVPAPGLTIAEVIPELGISVGGFSGRSYGSLIAALNPVELLEFIGAEREATNTLLQTTRARVQAGAATTAEVVPLETKLVQLDILRHAVNRLLVANPAGRADLNATLSPVEVVEFLGAELNEARTLRELKRAQLEAGLLPASEVVPLDTRSVQLEILLRSAQRRLANP